MHHRGLFTRAILTGIVLTLGGCGNALTPAAKTPTSKPAQTLNATVSTTNLTATTATDVSQNNSASTAPNTDASSPSNTTSNSNSANSANNTVPASNSSLTSNSSTSDNNTVTNSSANAGTSSADQTSTAVGNATQSGSSTQYPQHATKQLVPEAWTVPAGDVAITIDDGPSPYTLSIVQVLKKYHVPATFFFVGSRVQDFPDAVKAAVAAGDGIGDHTETHPLLTDLSPANQATQIVGAAAEIQQYDPNPITLFRPPYEGFNNATERILLANHMALALWNRDPRDWAAKTPQQIVDAVINGNPSGAVFDMHDKLLTLEALPTIIQDLQKMGLHFVVLPTPAGSTGITAGSHP